MQGDLGTLVLLTVELLRDEYCTDYAKLYYQLFVVVTSHNNRYVLLLSLRVDR